MKIIVKTLELQARNLSEFIVFYRAINVLPTDKLWIPGYWISATAGVISQSSQINKSRFNEQNKALLGDLMANNGRQVLSSL